MENKWSNLNRAQSSRTAEETLGQGYANFFPPLSIPSLFLHRRPEELENFSARFFLFFFFFFPFGGKKNFYSSAPRRVDRRIFSSKENVAERISEERSCSDERVARYLLLFIRPVYHRCYGMKKETEVRVGARNTTHGKIGEVLQPWVFTTLGG